MNIINNINKKLIQFYTPIVTSHSFLILALILKNLSYPNIYVVGSTNTIYFIS